jgi:hypothetical protein
VSEDFYHDDPAEEIPRSKLRSQVLTTGAVIICSIFFFQSTLAGNISLNSGRGIEFGQSVSQAVACSGETSLTLTPRSTFINGSPGAHYLQSVTVSNIPTSCYGDDFTISGYNDSSNTPLALFSETSTSAVISNDNGTFSPGIRVSGMTVESGDGSFTATFTTPVALSSSVVKLTIQSGLPFVYKVGDPGPGGGFIYYVNQSGFSCGATYTNTGSPNGGKCKYLEVAPSGWNGGSERFAVWAVGVNQTIDVAAISNDSISGSYNNASAIGLGYKNSLAIITQNGPYVASANDYAAGVARAYTGGSRSDWYLPTNAELNLLCQWVRGVPPDITSGCSNSGTINSSTYGANSAGFTSNTFWSSSEQSASWAYRTHFGGFGGSAFGKEQLQRVRPVRAF